MQLFIDSSDIEEIKKYNDIGIISGVTTNPSLIAKTGADLVKTIKNIAEFVEGPISAEVLSVDSESMIKEGLKLAEISENIVVKLPITHDGLKACNKLANEGIMVNMTLCFSALQALAAANAGATFVSPFIGRLDDIGNDGLALVEEIIQIFDNYETIDTLIISSSIRTLSHILSCAKIGSDIATIPAKLFETLINHPLTDKGLEAFLQDAKKSKQFIS